MKPRNHTRNANFPRSERDRIASRLAGQTGQPFGCGQFPEQRGAFTLFELLLAVAIFAIVLAAINTVFYSALRLRSKTTSVLDQSQVVEKALAIMKRDLQNTVLPGGILAGSIKIGVVTNGFATMPTTGLEIFTTTGTMSDYAPWGDIQKVTYQLRDPAVRSETGGRDLVRSVTRDLLAITPEVPEEQWLLSNVQAIEFTCYTGLEWRDTWDTSMGDTGLPSAIRVRMQTGISDQAVDVRNREPLDMIVPIGVQLSTNQTQTTTATGGGQ